MVCSRHLQGMSKPYMEKHYAPVGAAPTNIGVGRGDTVDTGLAVDGEEPAAVESYQLVLDVPSLQLQAVHLTPWQHVNACACAQWFKRSAELVIHRKQHEECQIM